jgi:hypothetical protein
VKVADFLKGRDVVDSRVKSFGLENKTGSVVGSRKFVFSTFSQPFGPSRRHFGRRPKSNHFADNNFDGDKMERNIRRTRLEVSLGQNKIITEACLSNKAE